MAQVLHNNPIIQKAHKEYEKFNSSKKMREVYESRVRQRRDHLSLLDSAREEGIEKGKIEDAKKMLSKGFSVEDIADITGLSLEEVNQLEKNHKD